MTDRPMTEPITITLTSGKIKQIEEADSSHYEREVIYEWLLSQIRAAQSPVPSYTRVQVLQELWEPEKLSDYYQVNPDNSIYHPWGHDDGDIKIAFKNGYAFAPTREWAEQIVQIRQGKYRPSQQDIGIEFYLINIYGENKKYSWHKKNPADDFIDGEIYFFTEPQRTNFIQSREAEQAKKEEKPDTYNRGYVDGKNDAIKEIVKRLTGL